LRNRLEESKFKNLHITTNQVNAEPQYTGYQGMPAVDFSKIRVGAKVLDDAILTLGTYKKVNPNFANKINVLKAIQDYDLKTMREISRYFYRTSGIYSRIIRYMACTVEISTNFSHSL
jgi:hypothetical protein